MWCSVTAQHLNTFKAFSENVRAKLNWEDTMTLSIKKKSSYYHASVIKVNTESYTELYSNFIIQLIAPIATYTHQSHSVVYSSWHNNQDGWIIYIVCISPAGRYFTAWCNKIRSNIQWCGSFQLIFTNSIVWCSEYHRSLSVYTLCIIKVLNNNNLCKYCPLVYCTYICICTN